MDPSEYELKCRNAHEKNFLRNTPLRFRELYQRAQPHTMLSRERLYDLYLSVNYVHRLDIDGDVLEVGCWGGGALGVALAICIDTNGSKKRVWGLDTFEGHPEPNPDELDVWGNSQRKRFEEFKSRGEDWCKVEIETVRENVLGIAGTVDRLVLVKGRAEETIPKKHPSSLSILRIDVDWYEPTLIALETLYPRLSEGGVLILDDYGHHSGSRKAFDEFFGSSAPKFTHIDYSCISLIKD